MGLWGLLHVENKEILIQKSTKIIEEVSHRSIK